MKIAKYIFWTAFFTLFIYSVFGQKTSSPEQYIQRYKLIAIHEMLTYKIPASISLAQGMLESSNGNSNLATEGNNHFGIKCHSDWQGKKMYKDDDAKDECFRVYEHAEESYRDHSLFLVNRSRYKFLFDYKTSDYSSWAKGLKEAGYATDSSYPNKLINLIEKYKLNEFDYVVMDEYLEMVKTDKDAIPEKDRKDKDFLNDYYMNVDGKGLDPGENLISVKQREILLNNNIKYVIVKENETVQSLCETLDLFAWQIYKYNELTEDSVLRKGQRIYIQPKRRKAELSKKEHVVKEGETMYSISQVYGIKLKYLYKKNAMTPGSQPGPGTKISLRKKVKK